MPNKSYSELLSDYFSITGHGKITDDLFKTLDRLGISDLDEFTVTLGDGILTASLLFDAAAKAKEIFGVSDALAVPDYILKTLEDDEDE